ncbi:MAG: hypothetical protein ACK5IN_07655 [Microbacterium sp.]|uniref:hypothetical protein n=1 Tax=Microbacterium sp. TaxID=51671 RepID=UPI003A894492
MTDDVPRRRPWVGWAVFVAIVVVVLAGGWLGVRGIGAALALSSTAEAAKDTRTSIATGDIENVDLVMARGAAHAADARSLTSDPVWRAAELLPFLGVGMRDMRVTAEAVDELTGVIPHLREAMTVANLGTLEFTGGRLNTTRLATAAPALADAALVAQRVDDMLDQVASTDIEELRGVARSIQISAGAATLLPTMLGGEGQRTLLVFVQDDPLGASAEPPVTAGIVRADAGTISFGAGGPLAAPVTGDTFPAAAQSAAELGAADAVILVDTALIPALVDLTGPLTIGEVEYAAADIATAMQGEGNVALAGQILAAVKARVADGGVATASLFSVLASAGERGQLHVWSAHDAEQQRLQQTPLGRQG